MIKDIKDLEKFLKVLRKQGVTEAKFGDLEVKLGELPKGNDSNISDPSDSTDPYHGFPQGELTPEQLMFYSSGGLPENDPVLKAQQ